MRGTGPIPTQVGDVVIRSSQRKSAGVWYVTTLRETGAPADIQMPDDTLAFGFQQAVEAALARTANSKGRIFQLDADSGAWDLIHEFQIPNS